MDYFIYRTNTHQYFAGYDELGKPTWVDVDGAEPPIGYGSFLEADEASNKLWNAGYIVDVDIVSGERIKDEW